MTVEGVLMKSIGGTPIPEGLMIYNAFAAVSAVILLSRETHQEEIEDWLLVNGYALHAGLLCGFGDITVNAVSQVNSLRVSGYAVSLVIDPEPGNILALCSAGYNTMQFIHTLYAVPSWRPDYEEAHAPWAEVAETISRIRRQKAADRRTEYLER